MTNTTAPLESGATRTGILHLSDLLGRPLADKSGESIGKLSDVIVRLRGAVSPAVTGLVASVGGRQVFVPLEQVIGFDGEVIKLTSARLDLRRFERREGEVLLRADVLGHRLIDVPSAHLIRAADLELADRSGEWVLAAVDIHRRRRGLFGLGDKGHATHTYEDWANFEPLIGHASSALLRGPFGRIRRFKPAQIADLLEEASKEEETEILDQVHADPELEADVFEELDDEEATRLLGARTDDEIAQVLARMGADDAADAIAELPQRRRQSVIDRLPAGQRAKVLTLMGYNPASAGGIMGLDFVTVSKDATVADALAAVRDNRDLGDETRTTVHVLDSAGHLCGVAKLVHLVQSDARQRVSDVYDDDRVRVGADTDVVDVAVLMSDYNLITVPVVDEHCTMIGLITVDDILEATVPDDWRRREAAEPPDSRHGKGP